MYLYDHHDCEPVEIGKTEMIKECLNPIFRTTLKVDFIFEKVQMLRFDVLDIDKKGKHDMIG